MKEKMLQLKEYVIAHKKQIVIGTGVTVLSLIGIKMLISKSNNNDTIELQSGTIEEVALNKEI